MTELQTILIKDLYYLGMKDETVCAVISFLETKEEQEKMRKFLIERYQERKKVTEEEVLRAMTVLTAKKKQTV